MYRILFFVLLTLPSMVSAMQVYPLGVQQQAQKRWCECLRSCFKTQAQRDAEEREAELQRQNIVEEQARLDKIEQKRREAEKHVLSVNVDVLRAAHASTPDGRHRRATGHTSDPKHIKNFIVAQQVLVVRNNAQQVLDIVRSVTPLGLPIGLCPPLSPGGELTARPSSSVSARESVLPQQSPTPAPHLVHLAHAEVV